MKTVAPKVRRRPSAGHRMAVSAPRPAASRNAAERYKKSVSVAVEGEADGRKFRNELVRTLNLFSRNDTTWHDDLLATAAIHEALTLTA
jgi:hypothetical protein